MDKTDPLSRDGFLGGRVQIWQPLTGYRAATDPVLLAAAVPARAGDRVLELGVGVGTAALCLAARVPGVSVIGVERQAGYAKLAIQNAAENCMDLTVHSADLTALPEAVRSDVFDHVMMNPPFFAKQDGTAATDAGREAANREETPLEDWLDVGLRRLAQGGSLTIIHLASRLGDILATLAPRCGAIVVKPLQPRPGRDASRVLVQGRKGRRTALRLAAPLILHEGDFHNSDGDDFSAEARAILRDGGSLEL